MTVGLAKELGAEGIRVNCVQPGLVLTDIHRTMGDPDRPTRMAGGLPLGRAGEPDEIAALVAFLASDEAPYLTGSIVEITGAQAVA